MINLPDFNDNFNKDSLTLDYIFNWGIENKVNVGLFYDNDNKEYTLMGDIKLENRSWWQSSKKKFIYSDTGFDKVVKQGNLILNTYNYNIDYSNSKDFHGYIAFVENSKNK